MRVEQAVLLGLEPDVEELAVRLLVALDFVLHCVTVRKAKEDVIVEGAWLVVLR